MKLKSLLLGVAMGAAFTSASALSVVTGNVPQVDSNLVRNPCGLATPDTGLSVQGCLNDNHAVIVDISSDEEIHINGGQATLEATDGAFSTLTISMASFSTLILDIDANADGFVTFTDGAGTSNPFALDDNGSNFFTITGIVGDFVTFVTTVNGVETDIVDEVKQIRLGQVAAIPEPETYALMLAGLAAVGFISRRRKAKR
jgi:hypothetical protein